MVVLIRAMRWVGGITMIASVGVILVTLLWQSARGPIDPQPLLDGPALAKCLPGTLAAASTATFASLVFAGPAAFGMSVGRQPLRRVLCAMSIAPLLTMPSVFAYALLILSTSKFSWLHAAGTALGGTNLTLAPVHAGMVLAVWLWPVPALVMATAFRRGGGGAYRLASLDARPLVAFLRGAVPSMVGPVVGACAIVFTLAILDSTVAPFVGASGVWSVELMADAVEAAGTDRPAAYLFFRAWPMIAGLALLVVAAWMALSALICQTGDHDDDAVPQAAPNARILTWAALIFTAVLVGAPIFIYAISMFDGRYGIKASFEEAGSTGARALGSSLIVALATGVLSAVMAASLLHEPSAPRWRKRASRAAMVATAFVALLPPALIGTTLVSFYSADWISPGDRWNVYDNTPWTWIASMICRYSILPMGILRILHHRIPNELPGQARTDGASALESFVRVRLPLLIGPMMVSAMLVAGLTLSDVATSSLVQPPQWGGGSLAVWTDGQMHFSRHNYTTALGLMMQTPGLLAVAAMALWPRSRRTSA